LVGSIYGRSSINIAYFVLIREQTWPPQAILVFDWWFKKNNSSLKPLVSEEKIFSKSTNQKQEWPVAAMFVNGS
jgi:hypothetical protein